MENQPVATAVPRGQSGTVLGQTAQGGRQAELFQTEGLGGV